MRLFLDESGFTGEDLANSTQPIFVLASTRADDSFCAETHQKIFAQVQSPELKHSSLALTGIGRRRILDFLADISKLCSLRDLGWSQRVLSPMQACGKITDDNFGHFEKSATRQRKENKWAKVMRDSRLRSYWIDVSLNIRT
jgi:hypothetical protein